MHWRRGRDPNAARPSPEATAAPLESRDSDARSRSGTGRLDAAMGRTSGRCRPANRQVKRGRLHNVSTTPVDSSEPSWTQVNDSPSRNRCTANTLLPEVPCHQSLANGGSREFNSRRLTIQLACRPAFGGPKARRMTRKCRRRWRPRHSGHPSLAPRGRSMSVPAICRCP